MSSPQKRSEEPETAKPRMFSLPYALVNPFMPGPGGLKTVTVDTTIAPGVMDDNMIGAVVPGLRWTPNAMFTVNAFDASAGRVRPLTLQVTGTESVTVPAGTFQAYRVELSGQPPLAMFVTTTAPHRVIKLMPVGAPVEFVLVK